MCNKCRGPYKFEPATCPEFAEERARLAELAKVREADRQAAMDAAFKTGRTFLIYDKERNGISTDGKSFGAGLVPWPNHWMHQKTAQKRLDARKLDKQRFCLIRIDSRIKDGRYMFTVLN